MTKNNGYHDLIVWQKSMDLCVIIYKETKKLPSEEKFGLVSQMRRCSVSIPSNIAEGKNRSSAKDFKNFLHIAKGSSAELATQIELCQRIGYFDQVLTKTLLQKNDELLRLLGSLIQSIKGQDGPSS